MKLMLEKETFTAQLISEFHESFSLIRFNQMSWNMNKNTMEKSMKSMLNIF